MRNCDLSSENLSSLARSNTEGKLPELKHLDIARNNITDVLQSLFSHNCRWNQLLTLNILDSYQDPPIEVSMDSLKSLRNLIIPDETLNLLILSKKSWASLRSLRIFVNNEDILLCLADAHEQGLFPALQNVCVKMHDEMAERNLSVFDTSATKRLVNLSIHDTTIDPTDPNLSRCLCYGENY